jgi:hypothetical protein
VKLKIALKPERSTWPRAGTFKDIAIHLFLNVPRGER